MATNIEMDEATYEDDSLHAENKNKCSMKCPIPPRILTVAGPESALKLLRRHGHMRRNPSWAKKFDGIVLVIRFGLAAIVHRNQAP